MIWKTQDPRPLGVPLDILRAALEHAGLAVERRGNSLNITVGQLTTQIAVMPPTGFDTYRGALQAVVEVRTALPQTVADGLSRPGTLAAMNAMATLGALTVEHGKVFVGSRLTVYEADDAWDVQLPLLAFAATGAADSVLRAVRDMSDSAPPGLDASVWRARDFRQVRARMALVSVCAANKEGLTARFGLRAAGIRAVRGGDPTAIWRLCGKRPHPQGGAGLRCTLDLPHRAKDLAGLDDALVVLNQLEIAPRDQPPHLGAWSRGKSGRNPAYVSFLPNSLYPLGDLAMEMSVWALARARWADEALSAMGLCIPTSISTTLAP